MVHWRLVSTVDQEREPSPAPWLADSTEAALQVAFTRLGRIWRKRLAGTFDWASMAVLHHLACTASARSSELADLLQLDASTMSRHVRNLEQAGYVSRDGDPADRRAARLSITEAGRSLLREEMAHRAEILGEATADWSTEDRSTLVQLLERLTAGLDSAANSKSTREIS